MGKFHSMISRRDFMKGLGLSGAGLGAAAATSAPVFHDLDELTQKHEGQRLPWWIKERDFFNPTTEVDWDLMEPYDQGLNYAYTPEQKAALIQGKQQQIIAGIANNDPGDTLKDMALYTSTRYVQARVKPPAHGIPELKFNCPSTRVELGIPKHEGTPEDNLRMITAALHFFGARYVRGHEITEKTKKTFYKCLGPQYGGLKYTFADVDAPYEDYAHGIALVHPNKYKWAICYEMPQTRLSGLTQLGLGEAGVSSGYQDLAIVQAKLMSFLRGLGYDSISSGAGLGGGGGGVHVALGILSGIAEQGRVSYAVSPRNGALVRLTDWVMTDLPVTSNKPIDAGMFRFCHTCKKCAELCPSGAISKTDEPSWEGFSWSRPGVKCWNTDMEKCLPYRGSFDTEGLFAACCSVCQANCVFSKLNEASIHGIIKNVISTTGAFNGFFKSMDDVFGYGSPIYLPQNGERDPFATDWWNRDLETDPWRPSPYGGTVMGL